MLNPTNAIAGVAREELATAHTGTGARANGKEAQQQHEWAGEVSHDVQRDNRVAA